jgi:signal transduction histidine kinase
VRGIDHQGYSIRYSTLLASTILVGMVTPWRAMVGNPLRFLGSRWPWRSYAYVASGAAFGTALLAVLALFGALGVLTSFVLVGLVLLGGLTLVGIPVALLERQRLRLMSAPGAPAPLNPHLPVEGAGPRAWLRARVVEQATWRELSHAVLLAVLIGPVNLVFLAVLALSGAMACSPLVGVVNAVSSGGDPSHWADAASALPASLLGITGILLATYLVTVLASSEAALARLLLEPRDKELDDRVRVLTQSRARLFHGFDAERRRIERDLHDGAQQRLVALAMTLGLAEYELAEERGAGRDLVARARREANQVLGELRDLVRGIHPQVLTDRGIEAAVQEIASRCAVPVTVEIDLPHRLESAVEVAAYFAVSEALTNVAKHSQAGSADVRGHLADDRLVITVVDDGVGGASMAGGTGLVGLTDRLEVLRGTVELTSPVAGPTTLRVEIPCAVPPCV